MLGKKKRRGIGKELPVVHRKKKKKHIFVLDSDTSNSGNKCVNFQFDLFPVFLFSTPRGLEKGRINPHVVHGCISSVNLGNLPPPLIFLT